MCKYFYFLIVILIIGCSDNDKQPESEIQVSSDNKKTTKQSDGINTNISDFKINEEVPYNAENSSEFIEEEGKKLVSPKMLFNFYPMEFEELKLLKNSSGLTSSGLGKYTTSTGIMKLDNKYLRLRLSDYYGSSYFPEINIIQNIPTDDANYSYKKITDEAYNGYIQWHNADDYGIINVFIYNRFNLFIEIDGYPEMSAKYKKLIEKFDLKKLKEIKKSNG